MRTITQAQQAVLNAGVQGEHYRISILDGLSVWRDLTSYGGFNAVRGFNLKDAIDSPCRTLDVRLAREMFRVSFAPGIGASPINRAFNPTAAPLPLIQLTREVKLEIAITPMDKQPLAGDWMEVFRGKIDNFDPAKGYDLEFGCRASPSGRLAQQWIKTERVYSYAVAGVPLTAVPCRIWDTQITVTAGEYLIPASRGDADAGFNMFLKCSQSGVTGLTEPVWTTFANQTDGSAKWDYMGAPTTAGNPLEQILQNILDDARGIGDGTVTLWTPTSPGWSIRQFLQQRQPSLDAVRALAQQIGWDIRPRWHDAAGQFDLTLYQPDRGSETVSPVVLYTFAPSDYGEVEQLAVDIANIRNNLRIIYPDRADLWPDKTPKRKVREYKNDASIAKYGDLFAEIQEDEESQLDSAIEVDKLGAAFISDCCEPTAQMSVPLKRCFPWMEVNDFYQFSANNLQFDTALKLAVTSFSIDGNADGKMSHKLELRGLPTIGAAVHLEKTSHPKNAEKTHRLQHFPGAQTPKANFFDAVGGAKIQLDLSKDKHDLLAEYEIHVYPTPGTSLDSTTLAGLTKGQELAVGNLIGGQTYYSRTVPRWFNASKLVRGQPSKEVSFVAGRASSGHIHGGIAIGDYPLNGGFETRLDAAGLPDHWSLYSGTFGTNVQVLEDGNGLSGNRYLRLLGGGVRSALYPMLQEANESSRRGSIYRFHWHRKPGSSAGTYSALIRLLDYQGNEVVILTVGSAMAVGNPGHWARDELFVRLREGDASARSLQLELSGGGTGANQQIDIDEVRCQYLGTAWYEVGDTTYFTENYQAVPGFANGWVNYGVANYARAAFRKNQFGEVELKGLVKSGTGNLIFTLPVGFRPAMNRQFICTDGADKAVRIEVGNNGTVTAITAGYNNGYVSLDAIRFMTTDVTNTLT